MNLHRYAGILCILFLGLSHAESLLAKDKKVTGLYKVIALDKKSNSDFVIKLESSEKKASLREIWIETGHIHLGLSEGLEIKLSAEIVQIRKDIGIASQILVFLKQDTGQIAPVWLISKHHRDRPLRGAKYIEMHAPSSDYLVF